jgi:hypothetical protein
MVLKKNTMNSPNDPGMPLFAFVAAEGGQLRAKTVVLHGDWIMDPTNAVGWLVSPGDKVIGVGQLDGKADCLVVTSGWGMGVWAPHWSGKPDLVSIHPNGSNFQNPTAGLSWQLNTNDERFRLLGVSDIDMSSDGRAEMVLGSSAGLAVLHENGRVWGETALDLQFLSPDGEPVSDAAVDTTPDGLVHIADFNNRGGADLLFQHADRITVLGKSDSSWTFDDVVASRGVGAGDFALPMAGDLNGDGQNDFPISSDQDLRILTVSGPEFREIGLASYAFDGELQITSSGRLVGIGQFDNAGQQTLLFSRGPSKVGSGFNYTHYWVADWTADSNPDLLVRNDQGDLLLYPFKNGSFDGGGGPINVGSGFNFTHYFIGRFGDLLVRDDQGNLRLYPFKNGSYYEGGGPINVGSGFNYAHYLVKTHIPGVALPDLIVRNDQGDLLFCSGKNGTFNEGCGLIAGFSSGFNFTHYFIGSDWEPTFSSSLLVRNDQGNLLLYPFNHPVSTPGDPYGRLYRPHGAGTGFNYSHYFTGNWDGDYHSDLIGRNDQGDLVLHTFIYPAFFYPTKVGTDFNFTDYFVADWAPDDSPESHDPPDLIVRRGNGELLLYPFEAGAFN